MRTKRKNYLPHCPSYPPGPPYQPYWQYPPCQESAAIPKALQSLPIPNRVAGTLFKQAQMMPKEHFPSLFGNMKGMAFGDWSVGSVQLQHRFTLKQIWCCFTYFFSRIAFGLMASITSTPTRDNHRFTFQSNFMFCYSFFQQEAIQKEALRQEALRQQIAEVFF